MSLSPCVSAAAWAPARPVLRFVSEGGLAGLPLRPIEAGSATDNGRRERGANSRAVFFDWRPLNGCPASAAGWLDFIPRVCGGLLAESFFWTLFAMNIVERPATSRRPPAASSHYPSRSRSCTGHSRCLKQEMASRMGKPAARLVVGPALSAIDMFPPTMPCNPRHDGRVSQTPPSPPSGGDSGRRDQASSSMSHYSQVRARFRAGSRAGTACRAAAIASWSGGSGDWVHGIPACFRRTPALLSCLHGAQA